MNFVLVVLYALYILSESKGNTGNDSVIHVVKETKIFDSYVNMTELEDIANVCDDYADEDCAKAWLEELDKTKSRNSNRMTNINFQYSANMNARNLEQKMKMQHRRASIRRKMKKKLLKFQWRKFKSPQVRRIFKLSTPSIQCKEDSMTERGIVVSQKIKDIYNHARPCHGNCLGEGETGIVDLFRKEKDYDKLLAFWIAWRNETGPKIKDLFIERMNIENIGAKENGYPNAASFELRDSFEEDNFNETIQGLFEEILPLYEQLHGYVRHCLSQFYPDKFDKSGPIPAHIFGNVWAQSWYNILPIIQKCRNRTSVYNIYDEVNKKLQSLTVENMFEIAEDFYTSIGMPKMTSEFWERSALFQPSGKLMDCHGSAFDFSNTVDYRIMMCTKKNVNDFTTIHHEMGHIEYYMAYQHLPFILQSSANPGFHEAIGDTIVLSVKTPEHLFKIGLIDNIHTSKEFDIDYLLASALERVAFLPFGLTMDSYILSIYNGSVPYDKLNEQWWNLRHRFQGLKAPIKRTENDFDPAAKYHVAFGISYTRYFVSYILQFQFYEALCKLSGHRGPLHRCDFYQSKVAGRKLLKMLEKGQDGDWRETLKILTGSRDLSSKSLLKFYEPLYEWLKETNERLNIPIGW